MASAMPEPPLSPRSNPEVVPSVAKSKIATSPSIPKISTTPFHITAAQPNRDAAPAPSNSPPTAPPSIVNVRPTLSAMENYLDAAMKSGMYLEVIGSFERYISLCTQNEANSIANDGLTTTMVNSYMAALIHMGHYLHAENAASYFMSSPNLVPNHQTYLSLFRIYMLSMNIRKARTLSTEMRANGISLDQQMIRIILKGEGRLAINLDSVDLIADVLSSENPDKPDMATYNLIIDAYLRCGRIDRAKQVLDLMNERGFKPDEQTYLHLIQHQVKREGLRGVESLMNSMASSGIEPQIHHVHHVLLCKLQNERMDLNAAVSLCESYNTIPDVRACNLVLQHLFKRPFQLRDLEAHFQKMKSLGIRPNSHTFTILLGEYQRKSDLWTRPAKLINQQWLINSTLVDPPSASETLFNLAVRSIKSDETSNHYDGPLRLAWNETALTSLAASLAKEQNYAKIVDLHEEVQSRDAKFDLWYSRVVFDACLKGTYYKQCEDIISRLLDSDASIDQHFGRFLWMELCRWRYRKNAANRESVLKALDMFLKFADTSKIGISEKVCNRIAVTCLDCGAPRLAANIIETQLMELGKESDIRTSSWLLLMKAYARKDFAQEDRTTGVTPLRRCVGRASRALNERHELPSKAFMRFLQYLSQRKVYSRTDRQYYAVKHRQLLQAILNASHRGRQTKGRQYLTRINILRWINVLEPNDLKEALYV
jgi:pentatricopeptide repeat protein